jgi:polyisoprenoid-binding protein YceI
VRFLDGGCWQLEREREFMKYGGIRNNLAQLGVLLCLAVALAAVAGPQTGSTTQEMVLSVDAAQSKVQWTLGATAHTVHGTFKLKRGSVRVDPATGKASGEIVVIATSGESGNDSRDQKMHKEVLESERFPDIVFRPDRVEGKLQGQGASSVKLHGVFLIHGAEHELTVPVSANLAGDRWTGSAKFDVPFVDWGLKNPSSWLLKVDHVVNVELELKGTLQSSPGK